MEMDQPFERRRDTRHEIAVQATVGVDDRFKPVQCTIRNLSSHGVVFSIEGRRVHDELMTNLTIQLCDKSLVQTGLKILRTQELEGDFEYACRLLFEDEIERKRLHSFLRNLPKRSILDRRRQDRRNRADSAVAERKGAERRGKDRRQHFGIFTESKAFAMRVPQWRSNYTYYQKIEGSDPGHVVIGGRRLISYSSKDYLGLAHDPRVKEASVKAIQQHGTTAWSRVLNGTLSLHEELERELAQYKGTQAALLFSGGYVANVTILTTLLKPGDVVFLDEHVHVSLVDGSLSARARVVRFRHNSLGDLERKIERAKSSRRLIIVDGVYSVEGDVAPLRELRALADAYDVPLLMDDAHGIGVMGSSGSGTPEHFNLRGQIEIEVASFSAAFAGVGGFVGCSKEVADYLLHFSNGVMFTTSLAPGTLAGALEALRIMRKEDGRRIRLWNNVNRLKQGLLGLGYKLCPTSSAVMSIDIGNEERTYDLVKRLERYSVAVNAFRRPAVERGKAKLRMSVSAAHSDEDIDVTLQAFSDLRKCLKPNTIRC